MIHRNPYAERLQHPQWQRKRLLHIRKHVIPLGWNSIGP